MFWFKRKKIEGEVSAPEVINEKEKIIITDVSQLKSPVPKVLDNNNLNNISKNNTAPLISHYKLPSLTLIKESFENSISEVEYKENVDSIKNALSAFKVKANIKNVFIGPRFTTYLIELIEGTRYSSISSISTEIGLALKTPDVTISPSERDRNCVDVVVQNLRLLPVSLHDVMTQYKKDKNGLTIPLGKDVIGNPVFVDICKLSHLLVAGTTGSGKSAFINSTIVSLLLNYKPDECKLVLIDPKKVELSNYNGIPHLLTPVVTDSRKASFVLQKIVVEIEKRYDEFSSKGVKCIEEYNEYVNKYNKEHPNGLIKRMSLILTIIDELSDLMLVAPKEIEDSIMRIAQLGRQAGVHIIISTEKPSCNVLSPFIKVNISSRLSFYLPSVNDSRTILDTSGAQKLCGKGDMLFKQKGEMNLLRVQGCIVSDKSISSVISYICKQQPATYDEVYSPKEEKLRDEFDDSIYDEVVNFVLQTGKISASLIQRKFRLGYNRAARIIDLLEERGIIGPQIGSAPREVLVKYKDNNL